jgi:ubiquinone/menaquinone biosynthesis C-methylase UbiE
MSKLMEVDMSTTQMFKRMNQPGFFDFAAEVGLTKHIGGLKATDNLIQLCQINKDSYVLDVGCGVGVTPCYLANKVGCRVMGVDIMEKMVEQSKKRAYRQKVTNKVDFKVADAQDLPFNDAMFNAVITESVTAFPPDKQKAVKEYTRVTKSGGFVGLNESVWLKLPPPPEVIAWAEQDIGANIKPLTLDAWKELMESAGLKEILISTYSINTQDEGRGILQRYGWGGMIRIMGKMLMLYAKSPDYREFVKEARRSGILPKNLDMYFGYGLFVGQKG